LLEQGCFHAALRFPDDLWLRNTGMAEVHILIVNFAPDLLEPMRQPLNEAGYGVAQVASADAALVYAQAHRPDLVIIDILLAATDGLGLCKKLKQDPLTAAIPLVLCTASDRETDIITGLALGVDVCLTRPLSPRVLLAHVQAALRRRYGEARDDAGVVVCRDLAIYPGRYEVRVGNASVPLKPTEFRLLYLLAQHPRQAFTRLQIVNLIRGDNANVTERSVDVHIAALRRKLGQYGQRIETIRGIGYRLRG
jgi:two-component system phosphate regulon response regulator PhoB